MSVPYVVAIDGPAASGKSTTAKAVASELELLYIDTGAMYRAATLALIEANLLAKSAAAQEAHVRQSEISQHLQNGETRTYLNGTDVSKRIRERDITQHIHLVSTNAEIRAIMVQQQQNMGHAGNVILDGRDIGTVVFPKARFKFFMVASVEERAKRRLLEFQKKGDHITLEHVISDLKARDLQDEMRSTGPLKEASDAVRVDTSKLSISEQVTFIITYIQRELEEDKK